MLRPLYAACDKSDCDYKVRKIPVEPFAFSEQAKEEPTEFELFFRTVKAEYRYILHVKKGEVVYESLNRVKMDTGRRSALFRRNTESTELKGIFGKLKISEDLSPTLPRWV